MRRLEIDSLFRITIINNNYLTSIIQGVVSGNIIVRKVVWMSYFYIFKTPTLKVIYRRTIVTITDTDNFVSRRI